MPTIRISTTPDPVQWDRYIGEHPNGGVYLSQSWKEAVEKSYGHQTYYLAAIDGQAIKGVLPFVLIRAPFAKGRLVSLPFCDYGGCLADNDEAARSLIEYSLALATKLRTGLEIRSRRSCPQLDGDDHFRQVTDKCRMVLELPSSSTVLWAGFKSKLRSQINRAKKEGLICRLGHTEFLPDFYRIFSCNMRDLGSPVHSKAWLCEILTAYTENARIGVVYKRHEPLAVGIVLAHGNTMTIPWASALREFSRLSPNMLLYWTLLEYAVDSGFQFFDFGRSTPNEGTYAFKNQWGAQPVPLYWYRLTHSSSCHVVKTNIDSNALRRLAEKTWQHIPLVAANVFGPRLRKYIDK